MNENAVKGNGNGVPGGIDDDKDAIGSGDNGGFVSIEAYRKIEAMALDYKQKLLASRIDVEDLIQKLIERDQTISEKEPEILKYRNEVNRIKRACLDNIRSLLELNEKVGLDKDTKEGICEVTNSMMMACLEGVKEPPAKKDPMNGNRKHKVNKSNSTSNVTARRETPGKRSRPSSSSPPPHSQRQQQQLPCTPTVIPSQSSHSTEIILITPPAAAAPGHVPNPNYVGYHNPGQAFRGTAQSNPTPPIGQRPSNYAGRMDYHNQNSVGIYRSQPASNQTRMIMSNNANWPQQQGPRGPPGHLYPQQHRLHHPNATHYNDGGPPVHHPHQNHPSQGNGNPWNQNQNGMNPPISRVRRDLPPVFIKQEKQDPPPELEDFGYDPFMNSSYYNGP